MEHLKGVSQLPWFLGVPAMPVILMVYALKHALKGALLLVRCGARLLWRTAVVTFELQLF